MSLSCKSFPKAGADNCSGSFVSFVRVRPVLDFELARGASAVVPELSGAAPPPPRPRVRPGQPGWVPSSAAARVSLPLAGYASVLDGANASVYARTLGPRMSRVAVGGTTSLFCYGYTGSGKTYTLLGDAGGDGGLCRAAGEDLLTKISEANRAEDSVRSTPLWLRASVAEVYNESVYDLLDGRSECSLRMDGEGRLAVRGPTRKIDLPPPGEDAADAEAAAPGPAADFAVVTNGQAAVRVNSARDLDDVLLACRRHRATGISTEHSLSSRSHAVVKYEIVDDALVAARERAEEAESIRPALQVAYAKEKTRALRHKLIEIEKHIKDANAEADAMLAGPGALGGRCILVDLAGADHDSRDVGKSGHTAEQRAESTAINMSLMALRACLRGLYAKSATQRKLPFRDSKITRLLEEVLAPKNGRALESIMLVNVAPGEHMRKETAKSLRYGQLFSSR
mmetsp:Transcript_27645/g.55333  ORF Transcript_27645/g.55333 Transcript_27645/m.55333 type:complete len:455 (-) Transcript_27645:418-1782(-)